jgi:hypothetical protein
VVGKGAGLLSDESADISGYAGEKKQYKKKQKHKPFFGEPDD